MVNRSCTKLQSQVASAHLDLEFAFKAKRYPSVVRPLTGLGMDNPRFGSKRQL